MATHIQDRARLAPADARAQIRAGHWRSVTTGACLGYVQANLVVLPAAWADEFEQACGENPQALPLLERTEPGVADELGVAPGADLRTDLPGYHVHREGRCAAEVTTLAEVWRDDLVSFLLGCSNSAEQALLHAGVRLRHLELGLETPVFVSSIPCRPAGRFSGPMVVSMRPVAHDEVARVVAVTGRYPLAHGAPVHIGDPGAIGIADLASPDWGDAIELASDEVPVFWACGVTPQTLIRTAAPELAFTHAPGRMLITDVPLADTLRSPDPPPDPVNT
jgi:uncharacterized protein YcsI (UPF0317 family)